MYKLKLPIVTRKVALATGYESIIHPVNRVEEIDIVESLEAAMLGKFAHSHPVDAVWVESKTTADGNSIELYRKRNQSNP